MGLLVGWYSSALAIPVLELDIGDGYYLLDSDDPDDGTIVASDTSFTLFALLNPNSPKNDKNISTADLLNDMYYLSVALLPRQADQGTLSVGTYQIDGPDFLQDGTPTNIDGVYDVTGDMEYGTPPLGSSVSDPNVVAPHGVFETYFMEFCFQFDSANNVATYNSQDNPGGINLSSSGNAYYASFDIDTSGIPYPYVLHFDLYSHDYVAPYSHDAQSPVPEPSTIFLFGAGLIYFASRRKKFAFRI